MSVGTVRPGSSDASTPSNKWPDSSNYVYNIPEPDLRGICYYLDQDNTWEHAASLMGYTQHDKIQFKQLANTKRQSPTEILISHWGDQNHTITELFMVLYCLQQYSAMEYLRQHVERKYHRLILNNQPKLDMLLPGSSSSSKKPLNGPILSDESNNTRSPITDTEDTESDCLLRKIDKSAVTMPKIPYSDLQKATNHWQDDLVLGKGGFGIVYKGIWKYTEVAIKKIAYQKQGTDEKKRIEIEISQSMNELQFLNKCRHDNVLPLYGFSNDGPEPCLVYQYMAGGSLEGRLRRANKTCAPLTFNQRKTIAIGTARGLQYLHTFMEKPLIHGDIKPANILLDSCLVPKIGDFGLVREGSVDSIEISGAYGTRGYVPNEFIRQRALSVKVDTFSYGVVLFELMTGLRAIDRERYGKNAFLAKYMWSQFNSDPSFQSIRDFVDKTMEVNDDHFPAFEYFIRMGLVCTNQNLSDRPNMVFVLEKLIDGLGNCNPPSRF